MFDHKPVSPVRICAHQICYSLMASYIFNYLLKIVIFIKFNYIQLFIVSLIMELCTIYTK